MLLALVLTAVGTAPGSGPPAGPGVAPTAAGGVPELPAVQIEQVVLPSGVQVVLARTRSPLASVSLFYHAGTGQDPPGRSGLAHLVEHVAFTGDSRLVDGQARRRLLASAGLVRARGYTGLDWTSFEYVLPADNAGVGIWLLAEQMRSVPEVTPARLPAVAAGVVQEHLETSDDRPGGHVWEQILGTLYPDGHPYHSLLGSIDGVSASTTEDVAAFVRRWYTPSSAILVVVGAVDLAACRGDVQRYLSGLASLPPAPHASAPAPRIAGERVIARADRDTAARLHLAWLAPARFSPDEPRIELLGLVARARLRPLHAAVEYEAGESGGVLRVSADAGPAGLPRLLAALDAELDRIAREPPSAAELEAAVRLRETRWLGALDGIDGLSAWAAALRDWRHVLGNADRMAWDARRYRSVTVEDLAPLARTALGRDGRVVVMPAAAVAKGAP